MSGRKIFQKAYKRQKYTVRIIKNIHISWYVKYI